MSSKGKTDQMRRSNRKRKPKIHSPEAEEVDDLDFAPAISPLSDGNRENSPGVLDLDVGQGDHETMNVRIDEMFDIDDNLRGDDSDGLLVDETVEVSVNNENSPGNSSDEREEAWLDALESGRLDEVDDELKRFKDPAMMTARQRAMRQNKIDQQQAEEELAARPLPESPKLSKEMIEKRIQRAQKRKKVAEAKKEKEKKETVARLIKKTDSRFRKKNARNKVDVPKVTYINGRDGPKLLIPSGHEKIIDLPKCDFPLTPQAVRCGVGNCQNLKKYKCPKTQTPYCSLSCYKVLHLKS